MSHSTFYRLLLATSWGLPALIMLLAYAVLAVHTGHWWPWFEIVHESGNRTLIGTVLYYQHAARELPLDLLLGVALGGCALWAVPGSGSASQLRQGFLAAGIIFVIAIIVVGTLWIGGAAMLWDNLLQMHTRPGEALNFGSHWRYHLLSRLILMLVSFGLAGLMVLGLRGRQGIGSRIGQRVFIWALGLFFVLTLVFAPALDPFTNAVYLGHQAREVFTHILVTIPLGWWICLRLSSGSSGVACKDDAGSPGWPLAAGIGGILVGLYLLIGALSTSAVAMGQTESLVLLVFPHFFEHTFSYLVVPLTAALVFETFSRLRMAHGISPNISPRRTKNEIFSI